MVSVDTLRSSWRPVSILTLVFVILINYVVFPLLNYRLGTDIKCELPSEFWFLASALAGVTALGRSVEKVSDKWKLQIGEKSQ